MLLKPLEKQADQKLSYVINHLFMSTLKISLDKLRPERKGLKFGMYWMGYIFSFKNWMLRMNSRILCIGPLPTKILPTWTSELAKPISSKWSNMNSIVRFEIHCQPTSTIIFLAEWSIKGNQGRTLKQRLFDYHIFWWGFTLHLSNFLRLVFHMSTRSTNSINIHIAEAITILWGHLLHEWTRLGAK